MSKKRNSNRTMIATYLETSYGVRPVMPETRRLSVAELQAVVARCRYKPGSKLECHEALSSIDSPYRAVQLYGTIVTTNAHPSGSSAPGDTFCLLSSRRVELAHVFSEQDALHEIRRLWHQLETHEADEWLRYGDETPFDPHRGERRLS